MTEVKTELKGFRVRLNEKEVQALLEAIDSYCKQLLKKRLLNKEANEELLHSCNFKHWENPETDAKFKLLCHEGSVIDGKIRSLESVERQFKDLLKGKTRGRRRNPSFHYGEERLWNPQVESEVRQEIRKERLVEKLLKEAEASGRISSSESS